MFYECEVNNVLRYWQIFAELHYQDMFKSVRNTQSKTRSMLSSCIIVLNFFLGYLNGQLFLRNPTPHCIKFVV